MTLLLFIAYLIVVCAGYWLDYLNITHLRKHGHVVPAEFEGVVDPAALAKISDYTVENSTFGLFESLFDNIVLLGFLFGGVLGAYDAWVNTLTSSFLLNG